MTRRTLYFMEHTHSCPDVDPLHYLTFDERVTVVTHFESGDVELALPDEDGFHRIRAGLAYIEGQRIAEDDGTGVTGVRLAGATADLERISRAVNAVMASAQSGSLHLSPDIVNTLQNLREAVTSRLEDRCWIIALPDGRPLAAHWLRADAEDDFTIEDVAEDRYGVELDDSIAVAITVGRWSELPRDMRV